MRASILMCCVVAMLTGGCASFTGQWLEDQAPRGSLSGPDRDFVRLALDFDPISAVRLGIYNETAGVVDAQSVQKDQYVIYDGGKTVQFGAAMARLEGDTLTANVAGTARQFRRWRGHSLFPPHVTLPTLTRHYRDVYGERFAAMWP